MPEDGIKDHCQLSSAANTLIQFPQRRPVHDVLALKGIHLKMKLLIIYQCLVCAQSFIRDKGVFRPVDEMQSSGSEVFRMRTIVEIFRHRARPKHQVIKAGKMPHYPAQMRGATLGESEKDNSDCWRKKGNELIVEGLQVIGIIGDFSEPVFAGHPGGADIAGKPFPVKAGKTLRSKDEGILTGHFGKLMDEMLCQLSVPMAGDPAVSDLRAGPAQGIKVCSFRYGDGMG